ACARMLSVLRVCGLSIDQARRRIASAARLPTVDDLAPDRGVDGVLSRADEDRPLLVARVLSNHFSRSAGAHRCWEGVAALLEYCRGFHWADLGRGVSCAIHCLVNVRVLMG